MKKITTFLFLWILLLVGLFPQDVFASKENVDKILREGGIFRVKNRGSGNYLTERTATNDLVGTTKVTSTANATYMNQVWVVTPKGNGTFHVRNAYTGRFIQAKKGNPIATTIGEQNYYIKYSAANQATTDYVTISWTSNYEGETCLNENFQSHSVLGWKANSSTVNDRYSDWSFEAVPNLTIEQIKAHVNSVTAVVAPSNEAYVRIVNAAYGSIITGGPSKSSNAVACAKNDPNDYTQVWQLIDKGSGKWALKNAVTDRYIQPKNGRLSVPYSTSTSAASFLFIEGRDPWLNDYAIKDGMVGNRDVVFHADQGGQLVGWYNDQAASNWVLKSVQVDREKLAEQRALAEELGLYNWINTSKIKRALTLYFSDELCTTLKPEIQAKSDEELKAMMSQVTTQQAMALPSSLQAIILKIKNNTWGHREKEFRIHSYNAYSDPGVWNSSQYIDTGYPFSSQTNPTGISAKRGSMIFVFLKDAPPADTKLQVMTTQGLDVMGPKFALKQGFNAISIDHDCHVFIDYVITNPNRKIADIPALPIHIEGGYVNGCFDITRGHKNADWVDMVNNLFKDEHVHLKSKYIQFNVDLAQVKIGIDSNQLTQIDKDGVPKAIEGALMRWDSLITWEREVMGLDHFLPYFNCMFSASSSSTGNPYASNYGTYYPGVGGILDYNQLTRGTAFDNGGNYWMIAHENGHLHQKAINIAGDTEMSVNFFSQLCNFRQGSNVGRGPAWSDPAKSFEKGIFYHEYDLWTRSRMYFQLWLYYHAMGHKKDFYPTFFAKLRKNPMERSLDKSNPMSGLNNYLKFAMLACDAAEEDLSEFFQFYGFFVPLANYDVNDYSHSYFTTPQADIDKAIAHMRKYPKKNYSLLFIDERIRKFKANNPAMFPGAMRHGTTPGVVPGNPQSVGEVGMFSDFVANPEYVPYPITVDKATGNVKIARTGKGAVGFKVYDSNNNFIFAANTYNFTIPQKYRNQEIYIAVALGDGSQRIAYDPDSITGVESLTAEKAVKTGEEKVYDLSGRRSNTETKGVYIIDGKRVIK